MTGEEGVRATEASLELEDVRLYRRSWTPATEPEATLLVVHGLSDHSARYAAAARMLVGAGIAVHAFDLRGHGRSGGARGHARRFDLLLRDVDRFRAAVAEVGSGSPLFLLGHSMGGLIVIRYLEEYPDAVRGAIIVSPWLGTAMAQPGWKVSLSRVLSHIAPGLPIRIGIPARYLSHDPAIARAFETDPLAHDRITPRLWTEAMAAMELAFGRADRIAVPVLLLIAGNDRIVDTERSRALGAAVPGSLAEVRVLEERYHELLNETDAAGTVAAIAAWIRARAADTGRPG